MAFSWLRFFSRRLPPAVNLSRGRSNKQIKLVREVEALESRDVPTRFAPDYVLLSASGSMTPFGSNGPTGYTPSQIEQAYGINQISFNGTAGTGAGETIAIVDAYSDPTITSDLHAFDSEFGLSDPKLTIVNQSGGTTLPAANADWAGEISLDVEWAHAIAPGANILLVEANNANTLFTAVKYAAAQKGVAAVSMSWGGSEWSGETAYDKDLIPPASNPDVVFISSAGDSGAPAEYPSSSPDVLSVGGTTLNLSSSGTYQSESAWSDGGGGISAYESQPSYQKGVVTQSTTKRTDPDVSYDSDPNTGFPVYQTYGNSSTAPWLQYGGTSDASPQWAALIAITDQGRALAGETALTNATLMPMLYKAPSADFHDVTSGTTDGSPHESATPGYDLATGLGTPVANLLVPTLVGGTTSTNTVTHFTITAPSSATVGTSFTITVKALNSSNAVVTNYTGTVSFTSSDGSAMLPSSYTFTSADDGSHAFTVTLETAGSQTVTATSTSSSSILGTATVSVSSPYFTVTGVPSTVTAGTPETFTVTAYNANGTVDTAFSGTVNLTSSDPKASFSTGTMTNGVGTYTVTFETAGGQSVTATSGAFTGTESGITIDAGALAQLLFLQEPESTRVNTVLSPAVTVEEVDKYGNVLTADSTSKILLSLGSTSAGATLSGGGSVTVSDGVATFNDLSLNTAGTGYTLDASEGSVTAVSTTFSITTSSSTSTVIENFNNGLGNYYYIGNSYPEVETTPSAAHTPTATEGLLDAGDGNWYFRQDSGATVSPGQTLSVWVKFSSLTNSRAYFGFGVNNYGLDSVVLAPNTKQFIVQDNTGFDTYTNLAASTQSYSANSWYLVQMQWEASGTVVANLYSSNGTTLLNTVTAQTGFTTAGPFAFRAIGGTTDFSTVTATSGTTNSVRTALAHDVSSTTTNVASTNTTHSGSTSSPLMSWQEWTGLTAPSQSGPSVNPFEAFNPWSGSAEFDPFGFETWSVRI